MKFYAWLIGIVVLVGLLTVTFQSFRERKVETEIRTKIALLKSHGWPTCGDDMPKGPPEAENAFLVIAPHITKNKQTYLPKEPIIKAFDATALLDPGDEPYLRKAIELDRELLDITAKAFRERKEFFMPHKWDAGLTLPLPEYSGVKSLQKVMLGEVALAIKEGRMADAKERLGWIHRMQKGTVSEPILIGRLVGRSMMAAEAQTLIWLNQQGNEALPLLKESLAAWKTYPTDLKPVIATEMLSGLSTIRYLDSSTFWKYQSFPWSLIKNRPDNIEQGSSVKSGDYIPKVGAARAKMIECLNLYLKTDTEVSKGVRPKHVTESLKATEWLWSSVPMFSSLVSGGPSGPEPTSGAQMELLRLEPAVLDFWIRAIEFQSKGGKLPADFPLGELTKADGLTFAFSTEGEKVVLTATEGPSEVARTTYPTSLDTTYKTHASARAGEIKRIEDALNPKKAKIPVGRISVGGPTAAPPVSAPAMP